jgi:hypothetical protein
MVSEFEIRASPLLDRSPGLSSLVFQIGSPAYALANLDYGPPIYASCIAGVTGACHQTQLLLVEMRSHYLFAQAGLEPRSFRSLPPKKLRLQA